ncbi:MAG: queuosine precursor transporter, partial [Bacteroidales bacterium]|nr:queuosine precursor transporter [Bacteroidales bacterium]
ASLSAYLVSQRHDVWAYHYWRKKFTSSKSIWIRNNLSTMVSQFLDSLVFTSIAFIGVYPPEILLEILLTTYFLKWIVAAADTPFIYLASLIKSKNFVG